MTHTAVFANYTKCRIAQLTWKLAALLPTLGMVCICTCMITVTAAWL